MSGEEQRMRPMGIADILDETVELYKSSFVLLVGIAAVMHVPYSILETWQTNRMMAMVAPSGQPPTSPSAAFAALGMAVLGLAYLLLLSPFVTGALTFAISERYLSRQVSIAGSFKRVFRLAMFGRLLLAIGIKMVVVAVPAMLLAVAFGLGTVGAMTSSTGLIVLAVVLGLLGLPAAGAAIYLLLRLSVLETSLVVENSGIGLALTRTWSLMRGNLLKCFVLVVIAGAVTFLLQMILQQPTKAVIASGIAKGVSASFVIVIIDALIAAVSSAVLAPVLSIVTILLYYDIRIRKEGFDLELLAAELDAKARQAGVWNAQPLPREEMPVEQTTEQAPPESESSPE